ncbi:hypothetical protein [Chryseobacterium hagamense]|uniref:DUF3592 domain-containing protein n=1 Tax=Chryseobacterium hagamense TaxID=395935 RepID=A0A511YIW9_9FLAO|nr:hypothetical protein [Chryseobacterium hagamense]GEN75123.1 hypothetical protein CHA01nite_08630 [Chryseobacterium hagamense]
MAPFKKYTNYLSAALITGLLIYHYLFINKYKTSYEAEGLYATGKIHEVKPYGRGTGYDFIYTFQTGGKTYSSETGINPLHFYEAQAFTGKNFLVVYLKSNPHINRLYISVPIIKDTDPEELKKQVDSDPSVRQKLKTIPSSGWFWNNYF